jgi:hypothetical protein
MTKSYRKQYYDTNKERALDYQRNYYLINKKKIFKYRKKYRKLKYNTDICYKILDNLRTRLTQSLKKNLKSKRTEELLGCSIKFLKKHLESQFKPGMTWDNHTIHGWHIDHVRPCNLFNLSDPKQQEQCFHYSNLQPLWAKDNLRKQ